MKAALTRALLFVAGLALVGWGLLPAAAGPARAAPPMLVTETPTGEPPTPTTPPPTPTATEVGGLTPGPTETPAPPPPTDTPPDDDDRPDPTATPTAVPATPTPEAPAAPPADPAIGKTVSPGSARVGDSVEYTITVTNLGGSPATGVEVSDTLPPFVTPTGVTASRGEASLAGQTVRVVIGDMEPGETVTITVAARVIAPAPEGNNRNLAEVTSTSPDGNPDNNQASVPLDTLVPVTLPSTGDAGRGLLPAAALLLGVALVAASLALRRRAA